MDNMLPNITYRVQIPGRFPGMNELIAANRTHIQKGNKLKRDAQHEIAVCLKHQMHRVHITKPVKIHYTFYEKDRRRDLDNVSGFFHKVFQDAMVHCGILKDDGWNYIKGYSDEFYTDKVRPRIEITIEEIGE